MPDVVERLLRGEVVRTHELLGPDSPAGDDGDLKNVRARLLAIHRKAVLNEEEKGIHTLHMALGMVTWPANDGGRDYCAPLLLAPVRIKLRAANEMDVKVDDSLQLNPVLQHVLDLNYDIRLSAEVLDGCVTEEDDGCIVDLRRACANVRAAASRIKGLNCHLRYVLGNFSFAKMAMVEDLKRNAAELARSPVLAAVAGHERSRRALQQEAESASAPWEGCEPQADQEFLVLDADFTQRRAVHAAARGQSCVIQGPPGTGKSQTIANLIAHCVAEGKCILFVAEKRAALEAVIKRLREVNLDHLVLDLHGASVSRKRVMEQLKTALEKLRNSEDVDAEGTLQRYDHLRASLNGHAAAVNKLRSPTNQSVHTIIGSILRLPDAAKTDVRVRDTVLQRLDPGRIHQLRDVVKRAAAHSDIFLGHADTPWISATIKEGAEVPACIDMARKLAGLSWPALIQALGSAVSELDLVRRPATLGDLDELVSLLTDFEAIQRSYSPGIWAINLWATALRLSPAADGVVKRTWAHLTDGWFRRARKEVRELRRSPLSDRDLYNEMQRAAELAARWAEWSKAPVHAIDRLTPVRDALVAFRSDCSALKDLCGLSVDVGENLESIFKRLHRLASDMRTPYILPDTFQCRRELSDAGLDDVIRGFTSLDPDRWCDRLEYVWLHSALDDALSQDPLLAAFHGRTHDQLVAEFAALDRRCLEFAAKSVARLHAVSAVSAMNDYRNEEALVRREAERKSRHLPLRELLSKAPRVLTRIVPCWVASPLSVSQLLDAHAERFDLVVFDEASQVLPEEAVPAIYRGKQLVVAGDSHQLPPTTFFESAGMDDDAGDDGLQEASAAEGFESLLDIVSSFLPQFPLEWHYRSLDERLIAFSNHHIYAQRLVTFPNARQEPVISHVLVPHDAALGAQEESASREVSKVVELVLEHARHRPEETLGVITMGIKHANRIQAALDRALESQDDIAEFFAMERHERFFVKNLETVQGDERDAIILSIGYGKDASGSLPHRFGPLLQDVGYRRLNVAITRARRRMVVVSSFSHDEVDLERARSRGVQLLKAFLSYAESGGTTFPELESAGGELNFFEADVQHALEQHGIKTRAQFGASRYRIDLVAMHPEKAGRPVLAIECDGASYHSGRTARDRDRLRQEQLRRKGWRFHRIWSTDWFFRREEEIRRAVEAFREAVRIADEQAQPEPLVVAGVRPGSEPTRRGRAPKPFIPKRQTIEDYAESELQAIARWLTSDGKLYTVEELVKLMFEQLPFKRMGHRIRARLERIARGVSP
ncbi:MAG: AAA domain-containing protein [Armatimonadota bacterium]